MLKTVLENSFSPDQNKIAFSKKTLILPAGNGDQRMPVCGCCKIEFFNEAIVASGKLLAKNRFTDD